MDIVNVANEIQIKINILIDARKKLLEKGNLKGAAIAEYEKSIAITIIKLRNGELFEIDGAQIKEPPVTLIEKIARGICWKERLEQDRAETDYKSLITFIQTVEAEMNALQSINRYLDKA
jgi:hypothetical protein